MRIPLNWLKQYVDIDENPDILADKLTMLGLEIEAVDKPWGDITKVRTGKILSIERHPNADKLVVCKTDVGEGEPLQIICGARNMSVGDVVPTALVGATLTGGFEITKRKMRGIESSGMMCSAQELGLGDDHSGLLILPSDTPVGRDFVADFGLDDTVFEIEVTPNRGDWASMTGVARELAALYGVPWSLPDATIQESGEHDASEMSSVTIEAPDLCPRYIGRVLPAVQTGASPLWMAVRLLAAGQRPINNVVDITNYVLLETGHPLHAFDYDLLDENRIVVRRAQSGETIVTIDGESHQLTSEMLIIADAGRPVAVAGVMGGRESEVGENTRRVFLESAYFDPVSVRRTSRVLGLQTEAAAHFQRGADPEMALYAVERTAALMQQLAGAQVAAGLLDEYPAPLPRREVDLRYKRTDLLLGTEVEALEQRRALTGLGFELARETDVSCTVRVPPWRHDVSEEADLIEEIARLHGYDKIKVTLPSVRQSGIEFAPNEDKIRKLRQFLVGSGLTEMFQWTFSSPGQVSKCKLPSEYLDMVALENPLSENQATMRSTLLPGMMAVAAKNIHKGNADIRAFETGPVFKPVEGAELPDEPLRLAILLTGHASRKHWSRLHQPVDFYDIKGFAEAVLDFFGVPAKFEETEFGMFRSGQRAVVKSKKLGLGVLGAVEPGVLEAYEVDQSVYLLEMDIQTLLDMPTSVSRFKEIPAFPPSLRDMAVVVDESVPAGELRDTALETGEKILESVEIFDIYTGKQVPDGKKSVAMGLIFQAGDRTLKDKEVQKVWDKILAKLQKNYQAELR